MYKDIGKDVRNLGDVCAILEEAFPNASKVVTNFTTALSNGQGIVTAFKGSISGLWGVIKAHPILAVVSAVALLATGISKLNSLAEENAKKASEAAEEALNKATEARQKSDDELKTLDELIKKYKDLKAEEEFSGVSKREELLQLQNQLVDAVGSEADSIDLVNGKLDEQLQKYKNLINTKAEQNLQDSKNEYTAAKNAADKAVGQNDYGFISIHALRVEDDRIAQILIV